MNLSEWVEQLSEALGVELDTDVDAILDLARNAAHGIDRTAAPVTTFLVGYAAARRGGGEPHLSECFDIAEALVSERS